MRYTDMKKLKIASPCLSIWKTTRGPYHGAISLTPFSTTSDNPKQSSWLGKITDSMTPSRIKTVAAGGAIAVIGASTVVYEVGTGFMNLTPYATGYYGFILGVITTGLSSIGFNRAVSLLYLSPDDVKKRIVDFLKVNTFVQHAFGGDIMTSDMIGYRSGNGHLTVKSRSVIWSPTFIEIVMGIRGANGTFGIVTAVASKTFTGVNLSSICVHIDQIEPRFVAGSDDSIVYHKKMAAEVRFRTN